MRSTLILALLGLTLSACQPGSVPMYEAPVDLPDDPPPADADNDGWSVEDGDCNDIDPAINPGATEICDGIDNDCSGEPDDVTDYVWYLDADIDGYGGETAVVNGCELESEGPGQWVEITGDCDDDNASIYPGASELCNGVNDNCNVATDEGFDQDTDGFRTCDDDCDDLVATVYPGALETCNGVDEDCDGEVDEGVLSTFYGDWDNDGYGDLQTPAFACSPPAGFLSDSSDCDDASFEVNPGATEICDGIDNDCDADIDDADGSLDLSTRSVFYADNDVDGFGEPGSMMACIAPSGTVTNDTDCDDSDPATYPGASETCDGADNDCDGIIDENLFSIWYADADADGFGAGSVIAVICGGPSGSLVDNQDDCDDGEANANPAATEVCDNIDNDCDGLVDEIDGNPDIQTLWDDDDGDGFGDMAGSFQSCPAAGWVLQGGDCNDAEPLANPSQTEVDADGIDNDCDGGVDNGGVYCCLDLDVDGYGDGDFCAYEATGVCDSGSVVGDGDCNDANFSYHPYALDILGDGLDTDCDLTDE